MSRPAKGACGCRIVGNSPLALCRLGQRLLDELLDANRAVLYGLRGGLGLEQAQRQQRKAARFYQRHTGIHD